MRSNTVKTSSNSAIRNAFDIMLQLKGESGEEGLAALLRVRSPDSTSEVHCLVAPFNIIRSTATAALSLISIKSRRLQVWTPLRDDWVRRATSDAGRGVTIFELSASLAHLLMGWGVTSRDVTRDVATGQTVTKVWCTWNEDSESAMVEAIDSHSLRLSYNESRENNAFVINSAGQLVALISCDTNDGWGTLLSDVVDNYMGDRDRQMRYCIRTVLVFCREPIVRECLGKFFD